MEWRACERLGLLPPRVGKVYDDNNWWTQALVLQYGIIRDQEESEEKNSFHKSMMEGLAQMMGAKKVSG